MTRNGQKQDAPFWVENASVEWPEDQAPFHSRRTPHAAAEVAAERRRLRGVVHRRDEVFALPDHRPLGSINRARWVAESASRKARLGVVELPAPVPLRPAFGRAAGARRHSSPRCCWLVAGFAAWAAAY